MEYRTPTVLDEHGFNIASPAVQEMFRQKSSAGYYPAGQSSFKYNGENPYSTAQFNNLNPSQYDGYYQSPYGASPTPPPGFSAMNSPENPYSQENPYLSMMQQGTVQSYNPYQPGFWEQMQAQGEWAKNYIKQANDICKPQQPQPQQQQWYGGYYQYPYSYQQPYQYSYTQVKEANSTTYTQLYNTGQIGVGEYCTYNNGGISFIGVDGKEVRLNQRDDWFTMSSFTARQMEEQRRQQEEYQNNMQSWQICININKKYLRDNGMESEADKLDYYQSQEYQNQQLALYNLHKSIWASDYEIDQQARFFGSLRRSDQPGYVNPYVAEYIDNWNKTFERRTQWVPEHCDANEYFNNGIMELQIIDDMRYESEQREKRIDLMIDTGQLRQYFKDFLDPTYDPVTRTSCTPVSLAVSDIEITLPEHIKRERYANRRDRFKASIFADNRMNVKDRTRDMMLGL